MKYLTSNLLIESRALVIFGSYLSGKSAITISLNMFCSLIKKNVMKVTTNKPTPKSITKFVTEVNKLVMNEPLIKV